MHFEEYGLLIYLKGTAALQIYLGGTLNNFAFYWAQVVGEADVFNFVPWKQIFFFTRPTDDSEDGFHGYTGGAYNFEIGNAYVSYCESAITDQGLVWSGSYWSNVYAGT